MTGTIQHGNSKEYELSSFFSVSCVLTQLVFFLTPENQNSVFTNTMKYIRGLQSTVNTVWMITLFIFQFSGPLENKGIPVITTHLYTNAFI